MLVFLNVVPFILLVVLVWVNINLYSSIHNKRYDSKHLDKNNYYFHYTTHGNKSTGLTKYCMSFLGRRIYTQRIETDVSVIDVLNLVENGGMYLLLDVFMHIRSFGDSEAYKIRARILSMRCSSTNQLHYVSVPDSIEKAEEALQWVNWGIPSGAIQECA